MTSKYRLIYFNVTGLGEPIRYLFAYGNIPFEDCRLEYEEWKQYKSSAPFGQVPILEINGKAYNQTSAICRYLAKQMGLMGQTDLDCLEIDGIVDTITDYRLNYAAYFKLQTDEERDTKLKEIREIHNPYYFEKFEKIVTENGGYFVRNKVRTLTVDNHDTDNLVGQRQ
ncbi:hypothetical protein RUM43_001943 [Polyplax serrata]|uniref:glutathione transferase n=1 Tax=Polyplax serrata TaxID=468196 RepID=A0AAN8SEK6_POLSC